MIALDKIVEVGKPRAACQQLLDNAALQAVQFTVIAVLNQQPLIGYHVIDAAYLGVRQRDEIDRPGIMDDIVLKAAGVQ